MKKNLGKILLFLIFPFVLLAGTNHLATYSLVSSKKEVYKNEAVEITFTAMQKDHTDAMFFFLEPKKSDRYEIQLLTHDTKEISYHNYTSTFKYLLFPLKEGDIDVGFDFMIKVASDKEIAQIYVGDYSRIQWMDMTGTKVKLKPLRLYVKPLKADTQLVGDFTITSKIQNTDINQYGSANIQYTLSGVGYSQKSLNLLQKIDDVTIFSDISDNYLQNTEKGYKLKRDFSYALVAKKDFKIPSIEIKAYSPKKGKYYTIKTDSYNIKVSAIDPSTLIDDQNFPQEKSYDFTALKDLFIAMLIFVAGFITARLTTNVKFKKSVKKQMFKDIREAKTPKELVFVLLQNYKDYEIKSYINDLELLEYKKSDKTFKGIKEEVLKKIM